LLGARRQAKLGPQEKLNQADLFCLLLLFYPMLVGLLGGQNSPFSLLLYAIMLNKIQQGDHRSEFHAGLACGLWLIKPNYPVLFLVGMLAAKRWRFIGGAAVSALCLYFLGVAQSGWLWPIEWLQTISNLTADEVYSNAYRYNSIGGLLTGTAIWIGRADLVPALRAVALGAGVLIAGWCAIQFAKTFCGNPSNKKCDSSEKLRLFALLGPLSLLVAPHSFFYDTVLCLPAALLWLPAKTDRQVTLIAALLLLVVNFSNNQQGLPVNPLILMVFGSALLGLRAIDQPGLADKK
jgi:hypothetical protein